MLFVMDKIHSASMGVSLRACGFKIKEAVSKKYDEIRANFALCFNIRAPTGDNLRKL